LAHVLVLVPQRWGWHCWCCGVQVAYLVSKSTHSGADRLLLDDQAGGDVRAGEGHDM
jgi:hypothetical protein